MALKRIPLTHFVDRSDRLRPKGLIRTADDDGPFGLTSAMRNPMADSAYGDYLLVDFRPRDNWFISQNTEEVRGAVMDLIQPDQPDPPPDPPYRFGYLRCDNDGVFVNLHGNRPDLGAGAMNVSNDAANGLFSLERDTPSIAVMLAAIRVISIAPSTVNGSPSTSPLGYFHGGARKFFGTLLRKPSPTSTFYRVSVYSVAGQKSAGTTTPKNVPDDTDASKIDEDSEGQWILLQVVKDSNNDVMTRVAGGQFPNSRPRISRPIVVGEDQDTPEDQIWDSDTFRVPIRLDDEARLGFATLARYRAVEGAPTTDEDEIDWNLFEANHVCKEYSIEGTRISFGCQDFVSWEAYEKPNGPWYRQTPNIASWQWATSGAYYYQTSGSHQIDFISGKQFSKIRPVLGNSGGPLLADTRGILAAVSAGFP